MKNFFDGVDIFLEKNDPLLIFLGIIIIGALIYYKLERKWQASGKAGVMKTIFMIVYCVSCTFAGFFIQFGVPSVLGGIIGFFVAIVLVAVAENWAESIKMNRYKCW